MVGFDLGNLLTSYSTLKEKVCSLGEVTKSCQDSSSYLNASKSPVSNDYYFQLYKGIECKTEKKIIIHKLKKAVVNNSYYQKEDVSNIVKLSSNVEFKTNLSKVN